MPYPKAQFPERIWDGLTDNADRVSLNSEINPDNNDFQRMSSELIAVQSSSGASLFPTITSGGSITVIDDDGISYPLTTSAIFLADASGGAFTIDLPTAISMAGKTLTIKKIDAVANTITLDGNGSETIDDAITQDIASQYDSVTMVSDGTGWYII